MTSHKNQSSEAAIREIRRRSPAHNRKSNPQDDLKMTWTHNGSAPEKGTGHFLNHSADINGADDPTRTDDLLITSELLYV